MSTKPIFICSLLAPYGVPSLSLFEENQCVRIFISSVQDNQDPGARGFREALRVLDNNHVPYKHKQMVGGFCIDLFGSRQAISSELDKILPTTMWPVWVACLHGREGGVYYHNASESAGLQQVREHGTLINEYADAERDGMSW